MTFVSKTISFEQALITSLRDTFDEIERCDKYDTVTRINAFKSSFERKKLSTEAEAFELSLLEVMGNRVKYNKVTSTSR